MYSVGLIVDRTIVSKQIYDIVLLSKKSDVFKINYLIIQEVEPQGIVQKIIGGSVGYNIRKLFLNYYVNLSHFLFEDLKNIIIFLIHTIWVILI